MKILISSPAKYIITIHINYKHSTKYIYYYKAESHTTFITIIRLTVNPDYSIQISRLATTISCVIQYAFTGYPLQIEILIISLTNYIIHVHKNYKHFTKHIYYYRA